MTKLGFQIYSARNFQPYSDIFVKLGKAGYAEVEGFGGIYADLDETGLKSLRAELDKNGLVMASGHFSPDFLDGQVQKSLTIAKTLGMDFDLCTASGRRSASDRCGRLARFRQAAAGDEQALQGRRFRIRLA